MMRCDESMELLSAKLDGELSPEQERALQAHLQSCPDCCRVLEAYRQIDAELAGTVVEPPAELKAGVIEQITKLPRIQSVKKKKRARWGFGSLAAAAAVLVLLLGTGTVELPSWNQDAVTIDMAAASTVKTTSGAEMESVEEESAEGVLEAAMPAEASQKPSEDAVLPWSDSEEASVEENGAVAQSEAFDLDAYVQQQEESVLVLALTREQAEQVLQEWERMDELEVPADLAQWETLDDGVWLCQIDAALLETVRNLYGGELFEAGTSQTKTAQLILVES